MPLIYRPTNLDYIDWRVPIEHYLWDRLAEAHQEVLGLSVGTLGQYLHWFRMIEAEWITREYGQTLDVNRWLRVEYIPHETDGDSDFARGIASICEETARAFEVIERPQILVTVLSAESDAPWVDSRAGYFIDKFPYDKICIPRSAIFNPAHLEEVVSHEYSHALNLVLTQAKCPLWLNEGIAMLSQPNMDPHVQREFATGKSQWKDPRRLDGAFHAELRGERDFASIHRAYEQAGWIVRYLLTLGDRPKIGDLMRAFNDNSFFEEIKLLVTDDGRADEALRQVYQLREAEVFNNAREWLSTLAYDH